MSEIKVPPLSLFSKRGGAKRLSRASRLKDGDPKLGRVLGHLSQAPFAVAYGESVAASEGESVSVSDLRQG